MPDNTNVNSNSSVVVVGRTAPVPPGQQKAEKSLPVVIASDQPTIPVAEQNKVQSEVALSLLGIPRSEVALGIFADVNTYDVNPSEWAATPEQFGTVANTGTYAGVGGTMGHGLTHIPAESGALLEAPVDKSAILTSKRFFRYQPGRVSAATFGVKTTTIPSSGAGIHNPAVRKYGIFDKYDGYYWETRNSGEGDNFCVVRRTQSITFYNPLAFGSGNNEQSQDHGFTNPYDPLEKRGSESGNPYDSPTVGSGNTSVPTGFVNVPFGDLVIYRDNLLMVHAGAYDHSLLQPEHKVSITSVSGGNAVSSTDLAKPLSNAEYNINTGLMEITTTNDHGFHKGKFITLTGIAMTCYLSHDVNSVPITPTSGGSGYNNGNQSNVSTKLNGVLTNLKINITVSGGSVTSITQLGDGKNNQLALEDFSDGDVLHIIDVFNVSGSTGVAGGNATFTISKTLSTGTNRTKTYPDDTTGYNVVRVTGKKSFTVNVGVSTVKTFYTSGGHALGLSNGQYVSYSQGNNTAVHGGFVDKKIYKVKNLTVDTSTNTSTCNLIVMNTSGESDLSGLTNGSVSAGHSLITPVPFIQPTVGTLIKSDKNKYASLKTGPNDGNTAGTGMFPLFYEDNDGIKEGYIDDSRGFNEIATLKEEIDDVNTYYKKWVNQNVDQDYWNVYEYRVPRSRFSGDRLDGQTEELLYSDAVADKRAGTNVIDPDTNERKTDESIWDLAFDKVTMYKVEFSWYGAVGALFLAYVPVSNGEARWVRVHHLRASNQLKISSLGNATLPITYMVYGGGCAEALGYNNSLRLPTLYGSASEHIIKYGASYYIDGGDRGTVKLFSFATDTETEVFGAKRTFNVGTGNAQVNLANATNAQTPHILGGSTSGLSKSYYVGAKVVTGNSLDQNIEITYVSLSATAPKLYLNSPLAEAPTSGTINIIPNRKTPLIGLKCRDFIQSSTGQLVRNRTQVYPTRLSTGSTGVVKLDLLKSPIFQTNALLVTDEPTLGADVNIGRRGKPVLVDVPQGVYSGTHTFVPGASDLANAIASLDTNTKYPISNAGPGVVHYDSTTGRITITTTSAHGLSAGDEIRILKESLTFTCTLDNNATNHSYPRVTDPIFDGIAPGGNSFDGTTLNNYSRPIKLLSAGGQSGSQTTGTTLVFSVTTDVDSGTTATDVGSAAEYIRDIGEGVYGYFRGFFEQDPSKKPISVLGFLENRGKDRTKNIDDDSYYFFALEPTANDIVLLGSGSTNAEPFLLEENSSPKDGTGVTGITTEFTLDQLSSIKVNPQIRAPIPKTGTVVASLFVPASGENYDLATYFDFNKEYLSFPLTNVIESLFLCASSTTDFNASTAQASISASLTWEEQ